MLQMELDTLYKEGGGANLRKRLDSLTGRRTLERGVKQSNGIKKHRETAADS